MQNIYIKTSIAILLPAFLAACSGGGSSSQSAPIANNIKPASNVAANGSNSDATLAELKEKQARQQAEKEKKERLEKEAADKQKTDEAKSSAPADNAANSAETPIVAEQNLLGYSGEVAFTKLSKTFSSWTGEREKYYKIEAQNDGFKAVKTNDTPDTITIVSGDQNTTVLSLANSGYYGYVTTDNEKGAGEVWGENARERQFDMFYGYQDGKVDSVAPSGNFNYSGKFLYSIGTNDFANKPANLELTYNSGKHSLTGRVQSDDTNGGQLNLDVKSPYSVTEGNFTLQVTKAKDHAYEAITKGGELKGSFLANGQFIVGQGSSSDNGEEWRGVFGAEGKAQAQ